MYDEKSRFNERGGIEEKLDQTTKYRKQNKNVKIEGKVKKSLYSKKQEISLKLTLMNNGLFEIVSFKLL